jgi:WD40 repeat protein
MAFAVLLLATIAFENASAAAGRSIVDDAVVAKLDALLAAHWQAAGVNPAESADDSTFFRRVTLDLVGRIPTYRESVAFAEDSSPDKRPHAIQRLMDSSEYALHLGNVLEEMIQGKYSGDREFIAYLRRSIAQQKPWDQVFREIMLGPWDSDEKRPASRFLSRRIRDLDDFNRRQFLQGGVASALGVRLGGIQAANNVAWAEELKRQRKQVLLLWLAGGASQFETWDPKPGRPTGAPFKAIPTAATGVHICELMPKMATLMNQVALVRSLDTPPARSGVPGRPVRCHAPEQIAQAGEYRSIEAHQGWIRDLVVLPDGSALVSVGDDMLVKVWDSRSGGLMRSLDGHAKLTPQGHVTALYVVAVTPDGKYLASGDRIGQVRVWETETGKLAQSFHVPILYTYDPRQRKRSIGGIRSLAFSPGGKELAVGGIGQIDNVDGLAGPAHVEIWDWQKPQCLLTAEAEGHKAIIHQLRFCPAGPWLVGAGGGSDDGLVAFWKPHVAADEARPAEAAKSDNVKPAVPAHRLKTDLHIHRFCFNRSSTELFAAGHGKLDTWSSDAA